MCRRGQQDWLLLLPLVLFIGADGRIQMQHFKHIKIQHRCSVSAIFRISFRFVSLFGCSTKEHIFLLTNNQGSLFAFASFLYTEIILCLLNWFFHISHQLSVIHRHNLLSLKNYYLRRFGNNQKFRHCWMHWKLNLEKTCFQRITILFLYQVANCGACENVKLYSFECIEMFVWFLFFSSRFLFQWHFLLLTCSLMLLNAVIHNVKC